MRVPFPRKYKIIQDLRIFSQLIRYTVAIDEKEGKDMLLHMLKKDLRKRMGVNLILFVFITLATVFLSSSINNILVVTGAVDDYLDYANAPDINIVTSSDIQKDEILAWLEQEQQDGVISQFDYESFLILNDKSFQLIGKDTNSVLDTNGQGLYVSSINAEYNKVFDPDGNQFILAKNEIAFPQYVMERNNLSPNDQISFSINGKLYTFMIKTAMKDATFGSEMVGMIRLVISQEAFEE